MAPVAAGHRRGRHPPIADARAASSPGALVAAGVTSLLGARRRRRGPARVVAGRGRPRELDHRPGVPHLGLPGRRGGRRGRASCGGSGHGGPAPCGRRWPCWPSSAWCRARTCPSISSWRSAWAWPAVRRRCWSWGRPTCRPRARRVAAALRRAGVGLTMLTEHDAPPGVTHAYRATGPGVDLAVDVRSDGDRDRDARRPALRPHPHPHRGPGRAARVRSRRRPSAPRSMGLWLDRLGLRVARPHAVARLGTGAALVAHDPAAGDAPVRPGRRPVDSTRWPSAWRAIAAPPGRPRRPRRPRPRRGRRRRRRPRLDAPAAGRIARRPRRPADDRPRHLPGGVHAGRGRGRGRWRPAERAWATTGCGPRCPTSRCRRCRWAPGCGSGGPRSWSAALRDVAGRAVGADEVELVRLARVQGSTLLALFGSVLALVVVLPQITDLSAAATAMADADWPWLLPVVGCVTRSGTWPSPPRSGRRRRCGRPFGLSYLTQLAAATLNRVTPNGLGGLGTNIRFLQRSGYDTTQAATIMALVSLNGGRGRGHAHRGVLHLGGPVGRLVPVAERRRDPGGAGRGRRARRAWCWPCPRSAASWATSSARWPARRVPRSASCSPTPGAVA